MTEKARFHYEPLDPSKFTFIFGISRKGMILVASTVENLYKCGLSYRFGFSEDSTQQSETSIYERVKDQFPSARIVGLEIVRYPTALTGEAIYRASHSLAEKISDGSVEFVVGRSLPGIALAAATASCANQYFGRNLGFMYERNPSDVGTVGIFGERLPLNGYKPKFGERGVVIDWAVEPKNGIYGDLRDDDKVLIVDDTLLSGQSIAEARKKIKKTKPDAECSLAMVEIIHDELERVQELKLSGMDVHAIVSYSEIAADMVKRGMLSDEKYKAWMEYRGRMLKIDPSDMPFIQDDM